MSETIRFSIEAPGYEARVDIPVDAPDKAEAVCGWFKMQLNYLARWTPGSTALNREWAPVDEAKAKEPRRAPKRPT